MDKRRFNKVIEEGRAKGKASLRQAQFDKALQGDTRMQIWLGRNYCDQKDDPNAEEHSTPLPWDEDKE